MTGLPVVVAGEGDIETWQSMAGPNVKFVGAITDEDKAALLALCRAFVFPSHLRSEAFGLSLVEAARAGKAMICAKIGTGTTFVNIDGETGLAVLPASAGALAEAMRRLAEDETQARTFGLNARKRYEAQLTADTMVRAYLHLYRA